MWYSSTGPGYLQSPAPIPDAAIGALYVHKTPDGNKAWIRIRDGLWDTVQTAHPHPFLKGYVLTFLDNGEPRWIRRESLRTYLGREKKILRETRASSAPTSMEYAAKEL